MKNSNKQVELFKRLMQKAKLVKPESQENQKHILISKKRQFKKILKRAGNYSLIIAFASYLFFFFKKIGVGISFMKSITLATTVTIMLAVSVISGTYYTVKYVIMPALEEQVEKIPQKVNEIKEELTKEKAEITKKKETTIEKTQVVIKQFIAEDLDAKITKQIMNKISSGVVKNNNKIEFVSIKNKNAKLILIGSVDLLEESYTIYSKIIDKKTSKVLFYESETAKTKQDIDSACNRLAQKIAKKI